MDEHVGRGNEGRAVMKIVVVGGDAAGMTAASQAKRLLRDEASITVIEQQQWTSYSACGIPYWIAGDTDGPEELVARSPEQHRANGIDVRTGMLATRLDPASSCVTAEPVAGGPAQTFDFDHLVIATGARPVTPPIPGFELAQRVHTLGDGQAAIDALEGRHPRRAVVMGAGYVGLEMAEAAVSRGLHTTVVDAAPEPMMTLDPDMGERVRRLMVERGVTMRMSEPVTAIESGPDGLVALVRTSGGEYPADIVFAGLGVRPRTELAAEAGLALGGHEGLLTDPQQRVLGCDNIWAGGDCTEVVNRLTGSRMCVPLGTHANKQGRVIGLNLAGRDAQFPGVLGTAITKFADVEISRTGLGESDPAAVDLVAATVETGTRAGYMPGDSPMWVKMTAARGSGLLRGAQIVGGPGAGKRIDAVATALWAGMTVAEVVQLDLAYAPPFSPVWDPVQIAARALLSRLD